MKSAFDFLKDWYLNQCDGDWEHQYCVRITTIDNPGWDVSIDLAFTELEDINVDWCVVKKSETDWFGFSVKDKIFHAAGDPSKLETLINKFREIAGEASENVMEANEATGQCATLDKMRYDQA